MTRSARHTRQTRHTLTKIATRGLLAAAGLVVLVLGPFVVQCRAPSGTVTAKFLFSECPPEVGCCEGLHEEASVFWTMDGIAVSSDACPEPARGERFCGAPAATATDDSGRLGFGGGPCGGCSENALFLFVGSRGSRDEGKLVGPIPYVPAEVHPASKLTAEIADERLADDTFLEAPPSPDGIHRVLRI